MPNNHLDPMPAATEAAAANPQPVRRRRKTTNAGVLEQAVQVRDQLRTTLSATKELIRTLKAERRGHKTLKLALDSLKQLQAVA
jgi:hypothetical protein